MAIAILAAAHAGAVDIEALAAQVERLSSETAYAQNSFLLLIGGMVVMFMAAGFCMLEAGLVRQRNAATITLKNIALYSIASLAYYFVGYRLMYDLADGGLFFGTIGVFAGGEMDAVHGDYSDWADWFFQMAFVATAASIVSGAVAERIKLAPFLIFTLVLTALIYPIQGSWKWGEGWLHQLGFLDFAGSTLVHAAGGFAALTGALIVGAREGKFGPGGRVNPLPGSNIPLAALGTFILWLGWFGFNGGSQLAFGTPEDVNAVARIFANTNTAAASGVLAAAGLSALLYKKKVDVTLALNGAIGGLVSITAEPLAPSPAIAVLIGAVGGIIVVLGVRALDLLKIDDVVGAVPAHLFCGIWGTIAVVFTNRAVLNEGAANETTLSFIAQLGVQLLGIVSIGAFVALTSAAVWYALKATMGIRASVEDQLDGLDKAECGLEAYPEFAKH